MVWGLHAFALKELFEHQEHGGLQLRLLAVFMSPGS